MPHVVSAGVVANDTCAEHATAVDLGASNRGASAGAVANDTCAEHATALWTCGPPPPGMHRL
jgi:hypothetical protein